MSSSDTRSSSLSILLPNRDPYRNRPNAPITIEQNISQLDCDREEGSLTPDEANAEKNHHAVIFTPANLAASHSIPFLPTRPSTSTVFIPVENRKLFLSVFIDAYLPQEAHTSPAVMIQSEQWLSPELRSMQASADATCLLQLDTIRHDERILLEARKRHAAMKVHFQQEVQSGHVDPALLVKSMQLMLVGEMYSAVSAGPDAWRQLVTNIVKIVNKQGPELLSKDFGRILFTIACLSGLNHALMQRKAFSLGHARWRQYNVQPGSLEMLLQHAARLPELLQRVDIYRSASRASVVQNINPLQQLLDLEQNFSAWLEDYHGRANERYHFVSSTTPVGYFRDTRTLRFTSFLSSSFHLLYWVCQLLLHASIFEISLEKQLASASVQYHAKASIVLANKYATLLRQGVQYLLHAPCGNMSRLTAVSFPLYVLNHWYTGSGQHEEAQSCQALELHLRTSNLGVQWDALLPWSFNTLTWLAT